MVEDDILLLFVGECKIAWCSIGGMFSYVCCCCCELLLFLVSFGEFPSFSSCTDCTKSQPGTPVGKCCAPPLFLVTNYRQELSVYPKGLEACCNYVIFLVNRWLNVSTFVQSDDLEAQDGNSCLLFLTWDGIDSVRWGAMLTESRFLSRQGKTTLETQEQQVLAIYHVFSTKFYNF